MGEELQCGKENDNLHDLYVVSVLKWSQIVGYTSLIIYIYICNTLCGRIKG